MLSAIELLNSLSADGDALDNPAIRASERRFAEILRTYEHAHDVADFCAATIESLPEFWLWMGKAAGGLWYTLDNREPTDWILEHIGTWLGNAINYEDAGPFTRVFPTSACWLEPAHKSGVAWPHLCAPQEVLPPATIERIERTTSSELHRLAGASADERRVDGWSRDSAAFVIAYLMLYERLWATECGVDPVAIAELMSATGRVFVSGGRLLSACADCWMYFYLENPQRREQLNQQSRGGP